MSPIDFLKPLAIKALTLPPVERLFQALREDLVAIFMLHRVADPARGLSGHDPRALREGLAYLRRRGYQLLSLGEICALQGAETRRLRKAVVFTMDDGFYDQARIAAPIFLEFGCPLTIFLVTGFLDGTCWLWDDRLKHVFTETSKARMTLTLDTFREDCDLSTPERRKHALRRVRDYLKTVPQSEIERHLQAVSQAAEVVVPARPPPAFEPMSWEEARRLEAQGVAFGPHSVTHSILSRTDDETLEREINDSWTRVRQELRNPLPVFCYPTGRAPDYGQREIDAIKRAGLAAAVDTIPDYFDRRNRRGVGDHAYRINRFSFPDAPADLVQYSSWIERGKSLLRGGR
jgi:peptidoglycan/xylan/chitin deacetylase (PgdA/CDA1 family)